jgi:hypothetical protein
MEAGGRLSGDAYPTTARRRCCRGALIGKQHATTELQNYTIRNLATQGCYQGLYGHSHIDLDLG